MGEISEFFFKLRLGPIRYL